jgi:hypothetical protein
MADAPPMPASATRADGTEAAEALPSGLVAITCTRRRRPLSLRLATYRAPVAPEMLVHLPRRSRCQR